MQLSDSDVAVAAAAAGAAAVRARYGTALTRLEKSAMDFATDADIEAEQAILEVLRAAHPADAYQGEELGASGDGRSTRTWLIDPLCGTLNFATQTSLFAVNVALRDHDGIEVAAAADPLAPTGSGRPTCSPTRPSRLRSARVSPPRRWHWRGSPPAGTPHT